MEEFKTFEEIQKMDEKHQLLGSFTGYKPDLKLFHKALSQEKLSKETPKDIQGQFNVAKNMALYTYFMYALAPEVQLKTYTVIEHALRVKANQKGRKMLKQLWRQAVSKGWISDSGFRHIKNPSPENPWCHDMIDIIPDLRNSKAHGSNMLMGDCLHHITSCADLINQLFPEKTLNKSI